MLYCHLCLCGSHVFVPMCACTLFAIQCAEDCGAMQAVMMTGTNKAPCLSLLCEGKSTVGKHHKGGRCARDWWAQLPSSGMHERCIITLVPILPMPWQRWTLPTPKAHLNLDCSFFECTLHFNASSLLLLVRLPFKIDTKRGKSNSAPFGKRGCGGETLLTPSIPASHRYMIVPFLF